MKKIILACILGISFSAPINCLTTEGQTTYEGCVALINISMMGKTVEKVIANFLLTHKDKDMAKEVAVKLVNDELLDKDFLKFFK